MAPRGGAILSGAFLGVVTGGSHGFAPFVRPQTVDAAFDGMRVNRPLPAKADGRENHDSVGRLAYLCALPVRIALVEEMAINERFTRSGDIGLRHS
jgi:hypothetical protein